IWRPPRFSLFPYTTLFRSELIFPIGLMMTGQIGALLVPSLGWQVMFLIGGIPGVIVTALLLRLPESPRWLIGKGRLADADAVIRDRKSTRLNSSHVKISYA